MKSMRQMQKEILDRCDKNGGWPRPVLMLGGVIATARNQAEYDSLRKHNDRMLVFALAVLGTALAGLICAIAVIAYRIATI